jgi:glutaminyl-peptide cyclotransferase
MTIQYNLLATTQLNIVLSWVRFHTNDSSLISLNRMSIYMCYVLLLIFFLLFTGCDHKAKTKSTYAHDQQMKMEHRLKVTTVPIYRYKVVNIYPHDKKAFTEGFIFHDGYLYESTGLYSHSTLRKIDLAKGKIIQERVLPPYYFAEGITALHHRFYQLTYKEGIGFVYGKDSLKLEKTFKLPSEGWGLTTDGQHLIMSNGSEKLYFLDSESFTIKRVLTVHDREQTIPFLNELEYIDGKIYANIWPTDVIAIISINSGEVEGWINIKPLHPHTHLNDLNYVANGIAYHEKHKTLLVTGKYWPHVYAIRLGKILT